MKWLAVILMTGDHLGRLVIGLEDPAGAALFMAGRAALPLFAWVMAVRLVEKPARISGYLARLLPVAVISQPIYALALADTAPAGTGPAEFAEFLYRCFIDARPNILFELAAGVLIALPLAMIGRRVRSRHWLAFSVGVCLTLLLGINSTAVILVAALCPTVGRPGAPRGFGLGSAPLIANFAIMPLALPAAVGMPVLVGGADKLSSWVAPRIPGWVFYAYYPAHLAALLAVASAIQ